jgi:type VI protein secretion system component VasA
MAVVRFKPDPTAIRGLPQGAVLPAGTALRSLLGTQDQTNCEFRTGHPVHLLPIEITEAEYISSSAAVTALGLPEQRGVKAAIRLRLKASGELTFNKIGLEKLSLFLGGPEGSRARLYEQLVANVAAVYVRPSTRPAQCAASALRRMRRYCRPARNPSTAIACCKNITPCPSVSCSSRSTGWIVRSAVAPAANWISCCC